TISLVMVPSVLSSRAAKPRSTTATSWENTRSLTSTVCGRGGAVPTGLCVSCTLLLAQPATASEIKQMKRRTERGPNIVARLPQSPLDARDCSRPWLVRTSLGGERTLVERQLQALPDIDQRLGERVDQAVVVIGTRRDAQPLLAFRHRRVIDRLDVDAVLGQQQIAGLLAALGIADKNRNDMGGARHHRQPRGGEHRLGAGGAILMALALPL